MTFSEFAQSGELAQTVETMSRRLLSRQLASVRNRMAGYYDRLDVARDLSGTSPLEDMSRPPVYGVALVNVADEQRPALLVDRQLVAQDLPEIAKGSDSDIRVFSVFDAPSVAKFADVVIGTDYLDPSTVIMSVPEPQPYFEPSDEIRCIGNRGTVGAAVSYRGQVGVLTAGHVAPSSGLPARCQHCGALASVAFTIHPAMVPALAITPDIAVVIPTPNLHPSPKPFSKTTKLNGGTSVQMLATRGTSASLIMGYSSFIYVPSMSGMWGETYFTTVGISQPGDSGAPVVLDGTDHLAGHIVGGSGGATSYIQSIDYQLAACGASLI